jgi:hypothetical protein
VTEPLKFLFDECLGKPAIEHIAGVLSLSLDHSQLSHILDRQREGIVDSEWIPKIAKDESWIVITSDRGRGGAKGGKLPLVCKQHGVTHVQLSSTIHHMTSRDKIAIILLLWPELLKLSDAPKGSRHVIRLKGAPPHVPVLVQVDPLPQPKVPPELKQTTLFDRADPATQS